MVNMISAPRSYQNNIEVMTTAKSLLLKTLQPASHEAHPRCASRLPTQRSSRIHGCQAMTTSAPRQP